MEFIIKLAALIIGAQLLQEPTICNCVHEQNVLVDSVRVVYLKDLSNKRCKAVIDLSITINADNAFGTYAISLHTSNHGKISQSLASGATTVVIKEMINLKKREKLWLEIRTSDHILATIKSK